MTTLHSIVITLYGSYSVLLLICGSVLRRSIFQAFGGAGLSSDYPLAVFFTWARVLRLADGPDEVHKEAIAKMEIRKSQHSRL